LGRYSAQVLAHPPPFPRNGVFDPRPLRPMALPSPPMTCGLPHRPARVCSVNFAASPRFGGLMVGPTPPWLALGFSFFGGSPGLCACHPWKNRDWGLIRYPHIALFPFKRVSWSSWTGLCPRPADPRFVQSDSIAFVVFGSICPGEHIDYLLEQRGLGPYLRFGAEWRPRSSGHKPAWVSG